jgi:hypothetical protein
MNPSSSHLLNITIISVILEKQSSNELALCQEKDDVVFLLTDFHLLLFLFFQANNTNDSMCFSMLFDNSSTDIVLYSYNPYINGEHIEDEEKDNNNYEERFSEN